MMNYSCLPKFEPNEVLETKNVPMESSLWGLRLNGVAGYENRRNDIIYWRPDTELSSKSVVIYFGGDVQDFEENMERNKRETDNQDYIKWNLENTACLMHKCFPDKHIVVIHPSRMDFNTFSCFANFVPVIKYGAPKHKPMNNALQHLENLLKSISSKIRESHVGADVFPELHESDMTLIGFSKGCVVLNQFLYEFHFMKTLTPDDRSISRIVSKIKDMYWLDAGHSGGKNIWITSRCLLETLASLGIKIHVHVTPYQMCDTKRPWIAIEERQFSSLLKEMNADIERVFHFENDPDINISMHFELLNAFRQPPPLGISTETS